MLINDTMGVLAAGRYKSPDAMIGLILGTGAPPLPLGSDCPLSIRHVYLGLL